MDPPPPPPPLKKKKKIKKNSPRGPPPRALPRDPPWGPRAPQGPRGPIPRGPLGPRDPDLIGTFEADPIGRRLECLPKKGINIKFNLIFKSIFYGAPGAPSELATDRGSSIFIRF